MLPGLANFRFIFTVCFSSNIKVKQFRRYPSAMDSNMETDDMKTDDMMTDDSKEKMEMLCALAAKVRAERGASGLHLKLTGYSFISVSDLTCLCKRSSICVLLT
ncbi:hypothetical protein RND81_02G152100 [Saponaria officinalis]|uniref:Uncharacterized protein n=1 Tax=Saponaria officinalis TaxID=3572 RepID=A0AAW1MVG8_SAPOF